MLDLILTLYQVLQMLQKFPFTKIFTPDIQADLRRSLAGLGDARDTTASQTVPPIAVPSQPEYSGPDLIAEDMDVHYDPFSHTSEPRKIAALPARSTSSLSSSVSSTSPVALAGLSTAVGEAVTKRTQKRVAEDRLSRPTTAQAKRARTSTNLTKDVLTSEESEEIESSRRTATSTRTKPTASMYNKTPTKTPIQASASSYEADSPLPLSDKAAGKRRATSPTNDYQVNERTPKTKPGLSKRREASSTPTARTKNASNVLPAVIQAGPNVPYSFAEALSGLGYMVSVGGAQSLSKDALRGMYTRK